MGQCDKCGYDHELDKFKESIKMMKFVYALVLAMVILNAINTWASGYNQIIKKIESVENHQNKIIKILVGAPMQAERTEP